MSKILRSLTFLTIISNLSLLSFLFPLYPNSPMSYFPNSPMSYFPNLPIPNSLNAQSSFFGYYETEFDQLQFTDQTYNFGYNKLRMDFEARPDDAIAIGANINIQKYFGKTTWNIFDFLPKNIWQPTFGTEAEFPIAISDTFYLDNVYLKAGFKNFDLTVGKQQISLGTGYAWNPLDIFNSKQLLDPTYEQTGVNAIRAEIPIKGRSAADFILSPKSDWENSVKMMQLKTGINRFDITGTIAQYNWSRTNFDFAKFSITELINERTLFGGAVEGELFGVGLRAEGAWNNMINQDDFAEIIIGSDYTFKNGLYILMEYLYNGGGVKNNQNLELNDYLQYLNGEIHSLMQEYLFGYANYPINDFLQFGILAFANINDKSASINPQLTWDMFQDVSLSVTYSQFIGDNDTEFGLQDRGWRIRLRGYF